MVRGVDRVKWSNQSVTEKSNDLCYARFTLLYRIVLSPGSCLFEFTGGFLGGRFRRFTVWYYRLIARGLI